MNWLSTICISEQDFVGIRLWKNVVGTVKIYENTQKSFLFNKVSEICHKLLTFSERWTFSVHTWLKLYSRCKFTQYTSSLTVAVCIEELGQFLIQNSDQLTTKFWYYTYFVLILKLYQDKLWIFPTWSKSVICIPSYTRKFKQSK